MVSGEHPAQSVCAEAAKKLVEGTQSELAPLNRGYWLLWIALAVVSALLSYLAANYLTKLGALSIPLSIALIISGLIHLVLGISLDQMLVSRARGERSLFWSWLSFFVLSLLSLLYVFGARVLDLLERGSPGLLAVLASLFFLFLEVLPPSVLGVWLARVSIEREDKLKTLHDYKTLLGRVNSSSIPDAWVEWCDQVTEWGQQWVKSQKDYNDDVTDKFTRDRCKGEMKRLQDQIERARAAFPGTYPQECDAQLRAVGYKP